MCNYTSGTYLPFSNFRFRAERNSCKCLIFYPSCPHVELWHLKPDLWVVADCEAKGAIMTKLSWFSVGSDSVLQAAHTGMVDKVTVWLMVELWGFRNCLQQFATQSNRKGCWFTLKDSAGKDLELLYEQWFLQPQWSAGDGRRVSSPSKSVLACKTNSWSSCFRANSCHISNFDTRRKMLWKTTSVGPQNFQCW